MTCIVGYTENGVTWLGADSLGSNGFSKAVRNDKKLFKFNEKDEIAIGFTSSYRMGQLLMYSESLFPEIDLLKDTEINHKYMVNKFVPKLIDLYSNNGFYKKYNDGELKGGTFLIAIKDKLWKIEDDFQVVENMEHFDACGSGECHAIGALSALENTEDNLLPSERIKIALESAEKYACGVQRPFYIINTKDNRVIEIK